MSLILSNVTKSYSGKIVIDSFSYEFQPSGLYIIAGDSGVGKTTLLRIISGIDKNYTGIVSGGGIQNVSFCFQEYRLFDTLTAFDNIKLVSFKNPSKEDDAAIADLLKTLMLDEKSISKYPHELSGGMKQRIAFARAVLKKKPILILDEPTKEVDQEISDIMMQIVQKEAKVRLVLMVTHKNDDLDGINHQKIHLGTRN